MTDDDYLAYYRYEDPETLALLGRITRDPGIFGGKPIIRGQRMAVEHILGMLYAGMTQQDILEAYDWLEPDDLKACLVYAMKCVSQSDSRGE